MADSTTSVQGTAQKPIAAFNPYCWTKTRVKYAKLEYRWGPRTQWQALDESYLVMGKNAITEPWNVEQVVISGQGITIGQFGGPYSRENDRRGAAPSITKYGWNVDFEYAKLNDIVISEREINKHVSFVRIHFKCLALPTSHDATVHKTPAVSLGQAELEDGEEVEAGADEAEAEAEASEAGDVEEEEGEAEEEGEDLNTEEFPLAQLFKDRTDVKGLEIRLTFRRAGASPKNSYRFVWPAVIHFLSGRTKSWDVTSKKEETEQVGSSIKLDQWLFKNNRDRPSATFRETPNSEGGFFWALRPKPNPSQRQSVLAAQPDSQQRRLAAPLPQYGQPTTPGPVPQFGVPLPHRPEAPSSSSNKRELESDYEARKQELYRRKVEQSLVEREAHRKWQEEAQRLKEMSDEFDEFVISGSNSMGKRPRRE